MLCSYSASTKSSQMPVGKFLEHIWFFAL